ncbi:P-loop containing nucleoside triphosphate hydrolase protein [Dendrothele bispora CBS 962.96]|uniref:DNA 3'-5' helicase n=1 Tax=Dendrothele bispora (strain CBS 962.96) TaxID=1314807 RepID=A0A4S8LX36_DENBC|nr:P-loop containing nucleoside triphosphate hydrolase protein [Dendrothele bispora CBS 962.96]
MEIDPVLPIITPVLSPIKERVPIYTCKTYLQYIKPLTLAALRDHAHEEIPLDILPYSYIDSLNLDYKKEQCYRLCLLCWNATEANVFLEAGTGFGKTLASILTQMFNDIENDGVTIIISPLKRLQASQAASIFQTYGLCTIAVNEGTYGSDLFWNTVGYDLKKRIPGCADVFIVTPEQFFRNPQGHISRFGKLVWKHIFKCRIRLTVVDEAHFTHTCRLPRYGLDAFREAYSQLDDIKILFGPAVPWAAMTATATHQILKTIQEKLLCPNYLHLRTTSNRRNIMYATHCVPGHIDQPENFACFLSSPFNLATQKRVLIFRDNMNATLNIATYLDGLLPSEYRGRGIVQHYNSMTSNRYQSDTHDSFTKPDGTCKILVATAGESTGIDHPDVEIVCIAGLPSDITDIVQRGGRAVRQIINSGLCVLFHEKWPLSIDLTDYGLKWTGDITLDSIDFHSDIDRPRKQVLTKYSPPQDCVGLAYELAAVRPVYYILPDPHIKILISKLPFTIQSGHDVTMLLEQTWSWGQIWADKIYRVIARFDREVEKSCSAEYIVDSDCDERKWAEVLERDKEKKW